MRTVLWRSGRQLDADDKSASSAPPSSTNNNKGQKVVYVRTPPPEVRGGSGGCQLVLPGGPLRWCWCTASPGQSPTCSTSCRWRGGVPSQSWTAHTKKSALLLPRLPERPVHAGGRRQVTVVLNYQLRHEESLSLSPREALTSARPGPGPSDDAEK